ncbi:MAG: outer membrane beta-barrel protein [Prevotella sp.]|nr:outer membrane beta-barrel protein [Prevotella sp.]
MTKKSILLIILLACTIRMSAQQEPEYLMEIGAGVGGMNYLGDFNGSLTKNIQPSASIVVRSLFNPYMGLRANISYGKMKGSSKDAETYYPELEQTPYTFDNTLVNADITYEYNFWPYGTGREYWGAKKLTPFIFGGIGATYVKADKKDVFTANIPIGLGVKYKVADRVNLGVEWRIHFSLSDELDGMKDPYFIKSKGAFKNTDCYSALQVTITYSFMAKCKTCHNDND